MPDREKSSVPGGFCRAYTFTAHIQAIVILMFLVMNTVPAAHRGILSISHWTIAFPFVVIPLALLKVKGGIEENLEFGVWIARGHVVIFLIAQIVMFLKFTKPYDQGGSGEGIIGMFSTALLLFCPWVLTALRSFNFQRNPSPDET